ncbi:MAG: NUDIX domain-containing protein [Alphaproteobacteria bacterium]
MMQKTKLSVCGVIIHKDRFLIVKRSENDDFLPNYWEFPGGGVETSENLEDALIRELKEEIGIDLTHNPKKLIGVSEEFMDKGKTERYLQLNYKIELSNEPKITLSPEHKVYDWATEDDPRLDGFLKEIVKQWEIHK